MPPFEDPWDGEFEPPSLALTMKMGRTFKQMSVRALAKASGLSAAQVSRIESGQVGQPAWETVVALARALNFNPVLMLMVAEHIPVDQARTWLDRFVASAGESQDSRQAQQQVSEVLESETLDTTNVKRLAMMLLSWSINEVDWNEAAQQAMTASVAQTAPDPLLHELTRLWPAIDQARRERVLQFARDQHELSQRKRRDGNA